MRNVSHSSAAPGQLIAERRLAVGSTFGLGLILAFALLTLLTACSTTHEQSASPLRVGITPDYPPLVYYDAEGHDPVGLEVDFATALASTLHRPLQFVVLRWEEQIPALVDGRTDIIMSGLSITQARRVRIAFSDPYAHNQLRAIYRRDDAPSSAHDLLTSTAKIGYIAGTTAETFVTQNCPNATRVPISLRRDVPFWLVQGRRVDAFVDDTFSLGRIFSENEGSISYLKEPLNDEELAWGVRSNDPELLAAVNHALAQWKTDGSLQRMLLHWIPYYDKYQPK